MREKCLEKANLEKFRNVKPKVVNLSQLELIETTYLHPECTLPLVIQPTGADIDLRTWAADNRQFIESQLLKHGAIIFRNFEVSTVTEFEQVAQAICSDLYGEYGDLPKEKDGCLTYQSTPYPADLAILFHNESSHTHYWPMKQWFFCVQAAREGGETPIVDCRKVYQRLNREMIERFQNKRLMYVRNFVKGLDVNWQEFFHTTDRSVVEEHCRNAAIDYEWTDNDGLRTRKTCPAVAKHPKTGEWSFFNQIQLHHIAFLEPAVRESLLNMFGEEGLPRNVYYGDGNPIEDAVVAEIYETYQDEAVRFLWWDTDILMVDNMLVAHGRLPFVGPRKVVVAMGEMMSQKDIEY